MKAFINITSFISLIFRKKCLPCPFKARMHLQPKISFVQWIKLKLTLIHKSIKDISFDRFSNASGVYTCVQVKINTVGCFPIEALIQVYELLNAWKSHCSNVFVKEKIRKLQSTKWKNSTYISFERISQGIRFNFTPINVAMPYIACTSNWWIVHVECKTSAPNCWPGTQHIKHDK